MGKKRRLNRFISKWLKSDLPEDRSTVLLLGVTRITTSPVASRRLPSQTPTAAAVVGGRLHRRNSSNASKKGAAIVRRNSSRKTNDCRRHQVQPVDCRGTEAGRAFPTPTPSPSSVKCAERSTKVLAPPAPLRCVVVVDDVVSKPAVADAMERSVDSIGTCSLDVDVTADMSDWSEISSSGTLRSTASASATPPAAAPPPHLPSYLSLACAINGYSPATHYDPVRYAAKSRDASPHRCDDLTTQHRPSGINSAAALARNSLLSPPNVVPLPAAMEKTLAQQRVHGEFYSSMKTATYLSKETFSSSGLFASKDAADGCVVENGRRTHSKCVSYESQSVTMINGQTKHFSETSMGQHFENGQETKSFIQQRVERLYGPGALAQGFFKPQKKRQSDYGEDRTPAAPSPSSTDVSDPASAVIRQSASSPTLPVLRHLRPEFRAQLPFISPKKGPLEGAAMPKSVTAPTLVEEKVINGNAVLDKEEEKGIARKTEVNGRAEDVSVNGETEKDGHFFLEVLEEQTKRLLKLAARVEEDISTPDLSEEMVGKLRSAAGKAKLLVTQKMQQFRGLCGNNINRSVGEAFPTTNEDLQGFWDMVMLQVDQVDAIFAEIDALRANGWREPASSPKPAAAAKVAARPKKTTAVRPATKAGEENRKQREALRRKMIEDRRRAMKDAQTNETRIEIFVPDGTGGSS